MRGSSNWEAAALLSIAIPFLSHQVVLARMGLRAAGVFRATARSRWFAGRRPEMRAQVHSHSGELRSFRFEEHALLAGVRLARKEPSTSADDAVPRNALPGRSTSHSKADGARASRDAQHLGQLAIGDNAPARDAFYGIVDALPAAFSFSAHFAKNLNTGCSIKAGKASPSKIHAAHRFFLVRKRQKMCPKYTVPEHPAPFGI